MTEMLLCQVLTSPPRYRQRGEQRLCTPTELLGQVYASRWQPVKSHVNRCSRKKIGCCQPPCCLSRRCPDQAIGHSRSRDYWHVLRLSDSADGLPPQPTFNNALHLLQWIELNCIELDWFELFRLAEHSATSQPLLFYRIELPPECPVLAIIFGGVEVAGHTPRLHLLKQVSPLRECPWPPVETLVKNICSSICLLRPGSLIAPRQLHKGKVLQSWRSVPPTHQSSALPL